MIVEGMTLNENAKAKTLITTFDASAKGARGAFIAAAVKSGMKATTAGAYWQRNKKLAVGSGSGSGSDEGGDKVKFLSDILTELKSSRLPGWSKGRIRNNVITSDLGSITVQSSDGNAFVVQIQLGAHLEDYKMVSAREVPAKIQELIDQRASGGRKGTPKSAPAKPTSSSQSPMVQEANAQLESGTNDSGIKVTTQGSVGQTSLNTANGKVGMGGEKFRYIGVGVFARWPGSGLQLSIGVRVFENGWVQATGQRAEKLTDANINAYIKMAQDMLNVNGVKPHQVDDVVNKMRKELKPADAIGSTDDVVQAITADDVGGDIKDAYYAAADGITSLESVVSALKRANFGPEAADLQRKIEALRDDFVMKQLGAKL